MKRPRRPGNTGENPLSQRGRPRGKESFDLLVGQNERRACQLTDERIARFSFSKTEDPRKRPAVEREGPVKRTARRSQFIENEARVKKR